MQGDANDAFERRGRCWENEQRRKFGLAKEAWWKHQAAHAIQELERERLCKMLRVQMGLMKFRERSFI